MIAFKNFIQNFKYSIGGIAILISLLIGHFVISEGLLMREKLVFLGFALGMGYALLVEWSYSR